MSARSMEDSKARSATFRRSRARSARCRSCWPWWAPPCPSPPASSCRRPRSPTPRSDARRCRTRTAPLRSYCQRRRRAVDDLCVRGRLGDRGRDLERRLLNRRRHPETADQRVYLGQPGIGPRVAGVATQVAPLSVLNPGQLRGTFRGNAQPDRQHQDGTEAPSHHCVSSSKRHCPGLPQQPRDLGRGRWSCCDPIIVVPQGRPCLQTSSYSTTARINAFSTSRPGHGTVDLPLR